MLGFLNINKPIGCTSRDVVNTVQRLVKPIKVGHAGTLDPLASGVLVVAVGSATRLVDWVQQQTKEYEATFRFGVTSPTDDLEAELTPTGKPLPSREQIEAILPQFTGVIQQVPPPFSAIKVDGKRAFDLARKGREVDLKPRPVRIDSLQVLAYESPELRLRVNCGAGTYIRSLGRDLGEALGCGAVMTGLVRTRIGGFRVEQARPWSDFRVADRDEVSAWVESPFKALPTLTVIELSRDDCRQLLLGQGVGQVPSDQDESDRALGRAPWGDAFALLKPVAGRWRIDKAFAESLEALQSSESAAAPEQDPVSTANSLPREPQSDPEPIMLGPGRQHSADVAVEAILQQERQRIASELHDGLVQEVMGAKLVLEATLDRLKQTPPQLSPDELQSRLQRAITWLHHAALESRELIRELDQPRPSAEQAAARLTELHQRIEREHSLLRLQWKVADLPASGTLAWDLFRVIQEGTRNALEHAQPQSLSVTLLHQDQRWIGSICDDGCGFDRSAIDPARHGLKGLERRLARHSGRLTVDSVPGSGTTLRFEVEEPRDGQ